MADKENTSCFIPDKKETYLKVQIHIVGLCQLFPKSCESHVAAVKIFAGLKVNPLLGGKIR